MYKDVLQSIEGIELFAIIGMIIFVLFFTSMTVWLFVADKKYIKKMSELPLKDDYKKVSGEVMNIQNFTGATHY